MTTLMQYGRAAMTVECFCSEINCNHISYLEEKLKHAYKQGVIDGTVCAVSKISGHSTKEKIKDLIDVVQNFLGI